MTGMVRTRLGAGNWLIVVGIFVVLGVALYLAFGRATPTDTADDFMRALGDGNVERLTELSYIEGMSEQEIEEEWRFTIEEAAKYYRFLWLIKSTTQPSEDRATVKLGVYRNANRVSTYEENFELPLVKVDGEWKVAVGQINRDMFPALPR